MEQNFHWIQWIQQIQRITEAWIGLNLRILSVTCVSVAEWYLSDPYCFPYFVLDLFNWSMNLTRISQAQLKAIEQLSEPHTHSWLFCEIVMMTD